ncbi:DeoR/GlpR transcriptional regulator, partial [Streptomyces sp. WAC04770]
MRLHVDQRHERVLQLVRERGSLRVAELAEELGMSAVTLRRDVEALAAQGLVEREAEHLGEEACLLYTSDAAD